MPFNDPSTLLEHPTKPSTSFLKYPTKGASQEERDITVRMSLMKANLSEQHDHLGSELPHRAIKLLS